MKNYPLIRKIYLYLFSMVGLVLLIIGCARFIDMGLKTYVFKLAYEQDRINQERPYDVPIMIKENFITENNQAKTVEVQLTEDQAKQVEYFLANVTDWETRKSQVDPITAGKHRDAATNLSLIIIGLPLYLYHWLTIRKELKA